MYKFSCIVISTKIFFVCVRVLQVSAQLRLRITIQIYDRPHIFGSVQVHEVLQNDCLNGLGPLHCSTDKRLIGGDQVV